MVAIDMNSKERKNLLAEKKETPFYQLPKLHDLSQRIAELTEELEELKSEKAALALSFFLAASSDGRFLCCDHCCSSYGDAAEVEDKIFVGGYDSTADDRRYYLGCAQ